MKFGWNASASLDNNRQRASLGLRAINHGVVVSSLGSKGTLTNVVRKNRENISPVLQMFAQVQQVGPTPPNSSHSRSRELWTNKISPATANLWLQSQVCT
jgi:hypothetical protein